MPLTRHGSQLRVPAKSGQAKSALVTLLCSLCGMLTAGQLDTTSFSPERDTFAFANETVFAYDRKAEPAEVSKVPYSRRCFVMTRAAMQFHRHAIFQPELPRLSEPEYADLVAQIVRRPAWRRCAHPETRIGIPGFPDLRSFSSEYSRLLQEMLGAGLPTYFRIANWRIMFPFTEAGQAKTARRLARIIREGSPQIVFVNDGFHLNHALVVHSARMEGADSYTFTCYDPNLPEDHLQLRFAEGNFVLPKTFYFDGGRANVYLIYTHPFD